MRLSTICTMAAALLVVAVMDANTMAGDSQPAVSEATVSGPVIRRIRERSVRVETSGPVCGPAGCRTVRTTRTVSGPVFQSRGRILPRLFRGRTVSRSRSLGCCR